MSNTFVLTSPGQVVQKTPVITINGDTSVVLTDDIGRQTIVSLTQEALPVFPIQTFNGPPILASRYSYQDVNEDSDLHQRVMKKIYTNVYNFVVPNQYPYILNYVKKTKDGYGMVKSMKEYKSNKTKESEYEGKLQYVARNVYSKSMMFNDVRQYLDTYDIKWFEIEDSKKDVYAMIITKLKKKLEDLAS